MDSRRGNELKSETRYHMRILNVLTIVCLAILLINSCYYDSEEYLFPEISACDTTSITYTQSVVPIINDYCIICHSNSAATALGGNVRLQDYADVKARADDGKLLGTISHSPGFVQMPQGASKLDNCTISTIRIWIEQGAAGK
jgi:hypothetical protein